jgi:hypothetical protein
MHLRRTDCYLIKPSQQSYGVKYVRSRCISSKGVDACFSRRQCHGDEEVEDMERALASFHAAVATDYGPEEAAKAAEDWIEELEKTGDEHPDWRSVTARTARLLALRVVERHPYC